MRTLRVEFPPTCFGGRARGEHMAGQLTGAKLRKHEGHADMGEHGLLSALTIPAIFGRTVRRKSRQAVCTSCAARSSLTRNVSPGTKMYRSFGGPVAQYYASYIISVNNNTLQNYVFPYCKELETRKKRKKNK